MSNQFYLGKLFDEEQGKIIDQRLHYDPDNLTTHGVILGMTGSGKTGLGIIMLEEAALQGIPAILIDPKGDLGNLLLHFPDLSPQDFRPWLDLELTRRAGKAMDPAAAELASEWQEGLNQWGISKDRILALKNAAHYAIFTPGSDAGIPVSVLSSLNAPGLDWSSNREILTERISSMVTAILGLAGYEDVDPIRSREHILMANIFRAAWSQNQSLDLEELILQIQNPPFEKLGAFPVDSFYPPKERLSLAMQLNNFLSSPSFELWRIGIPLDIPSLLWDPNGRPRHSVFYLAHLSDPERMFFITLLLSSIETWMRSQPGSNSLRAILYMDEIFGYLPPQRNPSSKQPLLRMLKQARAFGLGLLLASQNPVDLDYKALSNAGTWFIGKMQTEQDKQRVLDGLLSAASGNLDRPAMDRLISNLGKRVFIMNNVHGKSPIVFQTRWTMSFLAGPLTRAQLPRLNQLVGAVDPEDPTTSLLEKEDDVNRSNTIQPDDRKSIIPEGFEPIPLPASDAFQVMKPHAAPKDSLSTIASTTRPPIPAGLAELFLPINLSFEKALALSTNHHLSGTIPSGIFYHPALIASAQVRFFTPKYHLDTQITRSVLVKQPLKPGIIQWEKYISEIPNIENMDPAPSAQARFHNLDLPFNNAMSMANLQKNYIEWLFRTSKLVVRANLELGLYATPDISQAEFMKACADAAREARDQAVLKATAGLDRQVRTLEEKIAREERELKMDEAELGQRKSEEIATHAENILGVFGGSRYTRRLSSSLTKRRLTDQAKEDVQESIDALEHFDKELYELQEERKQMVEEANRFWGEVVNRISEVPVLPRKSDISLSIFGIAWLPYYHVETGDASLELAAFE